MSSRRSMLLLAAVLFVFAACSSSDEPRVTTTGPSLTTVPPIGTLPPPTANTPSTTFPPSSLPSTTAPPIVDPRPGVVRFVPNLPLEDGLATLQVVFVDGSLATVAWPAERDLVSHGLVPYGWAYVLGESARDLFIRPGTIAETLDLLGGAELIDAFPDSDGTPVGLWRPPQQQVDYLAFQFGDWSVLVFDYREGAFQFTEDERALWAASLHGQTTERGFLILSADFPLQLVYARGDFPAEVSIMMRGPNGEVELIAGPCEPGVIDQVGADVFATWCTDGGRMTVRAFGPVAFQQAVFDELEVRSVELAESPPLPEEDEG
jgi:hypothetical protein